MASAAATPPPARAETPPNSSGGDGAAASATQPAKVVLCPGHSRPVVDVRYRVAHDGLCLLVSAAHDQKPMLRWADTGDWIGTYRGHQGAVWSASLDERGERVATGSADFSAKLWDATSGRELASLPHAHVVKTVDFSGGERLLTGGLEKRAFVYDLGAQPARVAALVHPDGVQKAVWASALGRDAVVTGATDGALRLWDVRASTDAPQLAVSLRGEGVAAAAAGKRAPVADVEVHPDGTVVAVCGKRVSLLDARASLAAKRRLDVKFDAEAASLSPDGTRVAAGGSDLWLHVLDAETGAETGTHKGHHGPIFCVRFDPASGGKRCATGSEDGTVRLWVV